MVAVGPQTMPKYNFQEISFIEQVQEHCILGVEQVAEALVQKMIAGFVASLVPPIPPRKTKTKNERKSRSV